MSTLNLLMVSLVICLISGIVSYKSFGKIFFVSIFIFLISIVYASHQISTVFDKISDDDYKILLSSKSTCYKYDDCRKYFDNMVESDLILNYQLEDFKSIINKKVKDEQTAEKFSKETKEKIDRENETERIRQELRKKY